MEIRSKPAEPDLADASGTHSDVSGDLSQRVHLIIQDCTRRRMAGETLTDEEVLAAHSEPELKPVLERTLAHLRMVEKAFAAAERSGDSLARAKLRCPIVERTLEGFHESDSTANSLSALLHAIGSDSRFALAADILRSLWQLLPACRSRHRKRRARRAQIDRPLRTDRASGCRWIRHGLEGA